MMTTLNAKNLSLNDVQRLLGFQKHYNGSFTPLLPLEPLTDFEQQEIVQIREDFDNYLSDGKVLEGMVKALTVFPLMRLAGFYRYPIKITLEENIAQINIEDEDTSITGRFDILSVNNSTRSNDAFFWVLLIEAKNSSVNSFEGLAQLLTYAYNSLLHQTSVWGLTTNGMQFEFVYIQQGSPPTYELMPLLNLFETSDLSELLQVLKAICNCQS